MCAKAVMRKGEQKRIETCIAVFIVYVCLVQVKW